MKQRLISCIIFIAIVFSLEAWPSGEENPVGKKGGDYNFSEQQKVGQVTFETHQGGRHSPVNLWRSSTMKGRSVFQFK